MDVARQLFPDGLRKVEVEEIGRRQSHDRYVRTAGRQSPVREFDPNGVAAVGAQHEPVPSPCREDATVDAAPPDC